MAQDAGNGLGSFPSTHWSFVAHARQPGEHGYDQALGEFLRRYLPALRAYLVWTRRLPADQADDLLQSFVLDKVIRDQILKHAVQDRGRLRTFLLSVLQRYAIDHARYEAAETRAPAQRPASLDERLHSQAVREDPAHAFELMWAQEVLAEALERMEQECASAGRRALWGVFEARVAGPILRQEPPAPYETLVAAYGFRSPEEAGNVLITAKRMFARTLRAVVSRYARDGVEVEEELADLRRILAAPRA